jgi:DNA-directed RNA polymerase subunit RPC12/RpoP
MSIRVRCLGCNTEYALADQLAGKKVRCKKCGDVIAVKAVREADASLGKQPKTAMPPPPPRREKDRPFAGEQQIRPRRRYEDNAGTPSIHKSGGVALWLILGGVGLVLVIACATVGAVLLLGRGVAGPSPIAAPPLAVADKPAVVGDNVAPAAPAPVDNTPFHLAEVRRSVVFIRRSTPGKPTAIGSGFFVTKDGLIATNRHVVQSDAGPNSTTVLFVGVPSAANPDALDYFKG